MEQNRTRNVTLIPVAFDSVVSDSSILEAGIRTMRPNFRKKGATLHHFRRKGANIAHRPSNIAARPSLFGGRCPLPPYPPLEGGSAVTTCFYFAELQCLGCMHTDWTLRHALINTHLCSAVVFSQFSIRLCSIHFISYLTNCTHFLHNYNTEISPFLFWLK